MKTKRGRPKVNRFEGNIPINKSIVNDKIVKKDVRKPTLTRYKRIVEYWDDFIAAQGPDKSAARLVDLKEFVFSLGLKMKDDKAWEIRMRNHR
ncbi:hypothetical protein PG995_004492 [Apiospora arundinis]